MIRLTHNGVTIGVMEEGERTIVEALRAGLGPELGQGRIVERLCLDDREVPSEEIEEALGLPLRGFHEARVESRDVTEIVQHGLDSADDSLGSVGTALEHTAGLLRAGRITEANHLLADSLEGLRVLLLGVAALGHALGEDGALLHGLEPEIRPWLDVLASAQASQDWLRVADCLEYEIALRLRGWRGHLAAVRPA